MQAILAVTIPFFALVLCGYLAAQRHVLPESAIPGLNGFVLFFALPCMLFRFGASMPLARLIDPALIGVYLASAMLMVFFTIAAFPNTGFMGVPLPAERFGADNGRVARIVMPSTVLAFASVTLPARGFGVTVGR